jgi:transcriptional regulator with XRE-family HTH domain
MDSEVREALKKSFGKTLRASREAHGLSQVELQKRTGLNAWRLENGQIDPSLTSLHNIACALGVRVEELVKEE